MDRKRRRIAAIVLAGLLGAGAALLGGVYAAMGHVRPFYSQALNLDPQVLDTGRRELESRATALFSEARQEGDWQAVFTADQINGWLALQLDDAYGDALPNGISAPRVAIEQDRLTVGFRARRGGIATAVSADAEVAITETGDVAVRLLSVQAGALPLPAMQIADDLARACREFNLPVRWTQEAGSPVAIFDVSQLLSNTNKRLELDSLVLQAGVIALAGRTAATNPPQREMAAKGVDVH